MQCKYAMLGVCAGKLILHFLCHLVLFEQGCSVLENILLMLLLIQDKRDIN